jgi:hypothetical protein
VVIILENTWKNTHTSLWVCRVCYGWLLTFRAGGHVWAKTVKNMPFSCPRFMAMNRSTPPPCENRFKIKLEQNLICDGAQLISFLEKVVLEVTVPWKLPKLTTSSPYLSLGIPSILYRSSIPARRKAQRRYRGSVRRSGLFREF